MNFFSDLNYWGLICVPVGLGICFWPALLAWFKMGTADRLEQEKAKKK